MLLFPSLIIELCKRDEVEEYLGDNWISLMKTIYPLKICGEGPHSKSKKKKIKLGKSVDDNVDSCRPYIAGPFKELSNQMQ